MCLHRLYNRGVGCALIRLLLFREQLLVFVAKARPVQIALALYLCDPLLGGSEGGECLSGIMAGPHARTALHFPGDVIVGSA